MSAPSKSSGETGPHRPRLDGLRNSLMILHKALVDSERIAYEQTFGTLESPNKFLQLLINDPWFAWLHPLSELVVFIDEALEAEEPVKSNDLGKIINRARALLKASEEGEGFGRSYFEALQRDPDVVLAHAEVMKHLKR